MAEAVTLPDGTAVKTAPQKLGTKMSRQDPLLEMEEITV